MVNRRILQKVGNRNGDVLRHDGRGQAGRERCQREGLDAAQMTINVHDCAPRLASLLVMTNETNQVSAVDVEDGTGRV